MLLPHGRKGFAVGTRNVVTIPHDERPRVAFWEERHGRFYLRLRNEVIEWLDQNVRCAYRMLVVMRDNPDDAKPRNLFDLEIAFEDAAEAIHFKLRWR